MKWERHKKESHGFLECNICLDKGVQVLARIRDGATVCPHCGKLLSRKLDAREMLHATRQSFVHLVLGRKEVA